MGNTHAPIRRHACCRSVSPGQAATDRASGDIESLVLGGGITQSDVQYALNGRDLVISFTANPTDQDFAAIV